jgi:hypothetical protein
MSDDRRLLNDPRLAVALGLRLTRGWRLDHPGKWKVKSLKINRTGALPGGERVCRGRQVLPDRGSCAHALGHAMLAHPGGPLS